MSPDAVRNCLHCNEVFEPDVRHRRDQCYCGKPACRRASRVASQQRWLAKPEQKDWWHGAWNVDRVRDWRAQHPGYWKGWCRKNEIALQDTIKLTQASDVKADLAQNGFDCATRYVPELLKTQSPVVIGLIAQMYGEQGGVALQETIAEVATRLFEKGRAVIGQSL